MAGGGTSQGGSASGFLRQFAETFRFSLGAPSAIRVAKDAVYFLRSPPRDLVQDLYVFEPSTGEERLLLSAERLLQGTQEQLSPEEKARRERLRQGARGFGGFDLSHDGKRLLATLSGRLFVVELADERIRELEVEGGSAFDPRFSPDGKHVIYCASGDLYTIELATSTVRRLTRRSGAHESYGMAEYAAQEEMKRLRGYWLSPDSRWIVFQHNDDSRLPTFHIVDPADPGKPPQTWRYPRAGTENTRVRLGVMP